MLTETRGGRLSVVVRVALAVLIVAVASTASISQAAKKGNAKPAKQRVNWDSMVDQLASDVFAKANKYRGETLHRSGFHAGQTLLRDEMQKWALSGRLLQLKQSGWKPAGFADKTTGPKIFDISKIEKSSKVSQSDFAAYTRHFVYEAARNFQPSVVGKPAQAKKGNGHRAGKPAARKAAVKAVPVKLSTAARKAAAKARKANANDPQQLR